MRAIQSSEASPWLPTVALTPQKENFALEQARALGELDD
jgi:hypothetical protein